MLQGRDARKFLTVRSLEERKQFDPAKQKDIKNCTANDVLEELEPHEKPPRASTLTMRRVLEYRHDENENKSPKPRIVILGYILNGTETSSISNYDE